MKLKAMVSVGQWSYIVNENGNALRMTLDGYGSCTPADALQEMIDGLSPARFKQLWEECEKKKDIQD